MNWHRLVSSSGFTLYDAESNQSLTTMPSPFRLPLTLVSKANEGDSEDMKSYC